MEGIKIVLADKYDLVVGDTFQLYYRGIIEAPNPFVYDILAICEVGKCFPRYYEFTPEQEGEYTLTVKVFDAKKNVLGEAETKLVIIKPKENTKPLNILCVGSSSTAGGQWPSEANRRLSGVDGEPEGLGFKNISFVGTCVKECKNTHFEGYGGWMWKSYYATGNSNMWVSTVYNMDAEDQHSIWADENGYEWKLETLDIDRLKFIPYGDNPGNLLKSGVLKHATNAVHTDDIVFTDAAFRNMVHFLSEN